MNATLTTILLAILPLAAAAATGLLAKGAQYALHAVAGIKNAQLRDGLDWAITTAEDMASTVVTSINQSEVNSLKATGHWNATTAAAAKTAALSALTANLPAPVRAILAHGVSDLPAYLGTLIEAAVATAPNKTTAKAATPTP